MNEDLSKLLQEDKMAEQYFSSLPVHIQETIQQTGIKMKSVEELRNCAETLIRAK